MLSSFPGRRTAIIATLGPVSGTRPCLENVLRAGVDVVRLSMGNGTREQHAAAVRDIREVSADIGRRVLLLADLQGRKNRLGALPDGQAQWQPGEVVTLCAKPVEAASHRTWTTHPWQPERLRPGAEVLIDDGAIVLAVTAASASELRCTVVQGGPVTSGRGVTIPGATTVPAGLCERDADDLEFARALGVDLVALSFAASADDYAAVHAIAPDQLVIGKVEHPDALASLPSLASAFDGLMVARGDLAVEIPFEDVPMAQKRIVAECAGRGRLSVVATQLLHSMRRSTLPTRAEVSDIANAVIDGADALMVTGETGYGLHPVRVVEVLHRVIVRAERYRDEIGEASDRAVAGGRTNPDTYGGEQ
ncbi:pyruvate kinase [Kitasatospora sp. NPDC127121]|uniref:pyruvate kinase n=1 Tax=Kitasatospora sp. NPDC127121 TaxID=3345371 RepID=UPI0036455096